MEKHWHWIFIGYNDLQMNSLTGREEYVMAVSITVIGFMSEEDALIGAKDIVTRKNYVLNTVYECNTCRFRSDMSKALKDMTDKV